MAKQKSHKDKRELPEYLLNRLITIHADLESRKIPETHFITPHPNLEKLLEKNDNKPEPLPGLLQCLRQKPEGKPSKVIADKDSPEIVLKTVGPRVTYHKLPKKRKVVEDRGEQELKKMEDEISDLGKLRGIVHMRDLIARMRVEPTSGFIYLVYALSKEDINFHPFCYQIVSFYDVSGTAGKHFLTMSNQGVIQCVYGESTFYSMDEWDIDYSNWVELIKTRTFWQFQLYKYFTLWRKKITTRKFVENQTSLEASLIMVRPELRNALQQTQSVCESLSKESFFVSSGLEKLNLEEFMNIQIEQINQVQTKLSESRQLIKQILDNSSHGDLLEMGFTPDDSNLKVDSTLIGTAAMIGIETTEDGRYKMSFDDRRAKKKQCIKISRCLGVADYLVQAFLIKLLRRSLKILKMTLCNHIKYLPELPMLENVPPSLIVENARTEDPKNPLFLVNLLMGETNVELYPEPEDWINSVSTVINKWISTVLAVKTFQGDPHFEVFTRPTICDFQEERLCGYGPNKEFVLSIDKCIEKRKKSILKKLYHNSEALKLYASNFEPLVQMTRGNKQIDPDSIKNQRSLEAFRQLFLTLIDHKNLLESVVREQSLGVYQVVFSSFRIMTIPIARQLLRLLQIYLPRIGREKVEALTQEAQRSKAYLLTEPVVTINFVEYLQYLEQIKERVEEMEQELEYLRDLYDLLEEFHVPISSQSEDMFYEYAEKLSMLRNTIEDVLSKKELILKKFNDTIAVDIKILMDEVLVIRNLIWEPWLIDEKSEKRYVDNALSSYLEKLEGIMEKAETLKNYQKQCKVEMYRFETLEEVINDLNLRKALWQDSASWEEDTANWTTCPFSELNPDDIQNVIARYFKNIYKYEKGIPQNDIVPALKEKVEKMRDKLPTITTLTNPDLKQRHWSRIEQILNQKIDTDKPITLEQLEQLNIYKYHEKLTEISAQATSEAGLEDLLKKTEDIWKTLELPLTKYKDAKDIYILGGVEEIQLALDETNINLSTMISSRNVGPIKHKVDDWIRRVDIFTKTLDEWLTCQKNWLYLEPIFSAPDIQRQLPAEAKQFQTVDKSWKMIMRKTAKNALAFPACTTEGTYDIFKNNNKLLEQIMKCLEAYLESKRMVFPRFYFLSNEELLEILAQTRNPHAVQPHLRKCFDAISKLEFGLKNVDDSSQKVDKSDDKDLAQLTNDIKAMISPEGERVGLGKGLKARGNVEDWLGKVEESMFFSMWSLMKNCLRDFIIRQRTEWVLNHSSQLILTISQVMWVRDVHSALTIEYKYREEAVHILEKKCFDELNDLATMVRGELTKLQRNILGALITLDVHSRDIVSSLVHNHIHSVSNFEWIKQFRYYWEKKIDNCVACMASSRHIYNYEYLGASGRLVLTPLTDKCYLCLMGALQLDLGGAPAGPAGTGKTETTKDLAKALAIQCVVFNCSEGLDYKMMGRFFSGLAQCGSWCCFDEFNRIDIEVLSVIAQQLITIRNAKLAKLKKFMFERREIKLQPQCATFITMNPGYAGRTELPDNLKSVFRPFAMMVPDYTLIAEVILYSEGFESSKNLAQKMVNMYKLCSEQLSQQDHYDFGMRAVKSVLTMAGSLKRDEPYYAEDVVLIRALRDSNLPKFIAEDAVLFQGILHDLFPGIDIPTPDLGVFSTHMESVVFSMNLEPEFITFLKTIQLYETILVRHGVMTVGPTGGGKTTILNVLKGTLTRLYQQEAVGPNYRPVTMYTLNPKSITMGELFGEINHITLEWRDGLLGFFVRTAVNCMEERHQWIVCDGPVDAVWVENLNTVLDDNKMLCLSNSERIKLTPWVRMLFEVQDLAQASPATVSRCGMVYIDPEDLKYLPYVKSWAKTTQFEGTFPDQMRDLLLQLFVEWVPKGLAFIKKNTTYVFYQPDISKMGTFCAILKSLLKTKILVEKYLDWDSVKKAIHQCFVLGYLWSLGGNLDENSREIFESFIRGLFEDVGDFRLPPGLDYWTVFYDFENKKLEQWQTLVMPFIYASDTPFFQMTVPTLDTVRFGIIIKNLLEENYPVLLTGGTGVGKSIIAKDVLNTLVRKDVWQTVVINFSAQSSSSRTQEMIESKLEKKRRNVLGAPIGKRVIVFVDDVNMPKVEQYGAQPPIELLRQFLDFKGMYDREKLYWKEITDVVLCTACAPPGGGRNPLTPRFVRHFAMFLIPSPSEMNLRLIFKSILKGFLDDFSNDIQALTEILVLASINIYQTISEDLLPTPAKSHYVFNLRDLSKLIQGILQANPYTMRDPKEMMRLFFHESLRVFHDRLIDVDDRSYFYRLVRDTCSKFFGQDVLSLPEEGPIVNPPVLLFADFQKPLAKEDRIYEEVTNISKLKSALEDYLVDYNLVKGKDMNLIFFMDAVQHICRLARILRVERGNALLVGVGGMGKQSLTNLAAHVNLCACFQIQISRNYDFNSFRGDLRLLYFKAGAENVETVFLFTDSQIQQEEYLEDINNILNTGEISNLFEGDDYERVMVSCRAAAKASGVNDSNRDAIYDYFISQVRRKLHLVICMSPIGEAFRQRCRMFPSLVNCCTIDWYTNWPEEALISVAQNSLATLLPKEYIDKAASAFYTMHTSVEEMNVRYFKEKRRHYYVTPSSYLDLLKLYDVLLKNKRDQLQGTRNKIANGLKKIFETNDLVAIMQEQLIKMEPQLQEKSEATAELMSSLIKEKSAADEVRQVVLNEEAIVKAKAVVCQNLSDDAQRDLDLVLPALDAATKALDSLNKSEINEVRVFISPPSLVKFVMEAVCLLLGQKQDWATAKMVLGDGNFLKKLKEYDKDNVSDALLKKLKPFIDNDEFNPDAVGTQSFACRSLCMWVKAVDTYARVFRVVEPKRQKVQEAEKELNQIMGILRAKQQNLADVEQQIAALEAKYDASVQDKANLEAAMDLCSARLNRAGRLTSALVDEQIRWEQLVEAFKDEIMNTIGDVLIASGCVAYLGPFTVNYREELISQWHKLIIKLAIPLSPMFSLITVLADPYEVRFWNSCGLPGDTVSIESAIFVTNTIRWPLMIDPQEQANQWIRTMEAENNIKMVKLTDHGFMKTLVNAIRAGLPVLIWEVGETLDPSLSPILQKRTYMQSGRMLMKIGDTEVEYDNKFRLYITTKLPNPHYLPDICIQVAIVNFTVTPNGLEEQLLVDVVRLEKPDLEAQRTELIININKDKTQLKALEDKILKMLYTSQGNILDDEELIETLNISKETSAIIASRLAESEDTEIQISAARNVYKTVAARGSCLYFVIAQLSEIDPMYQFSLKYFNRIFNQCITNEPHEDKFSKKLENLINSLTIAVYNNVSHGLFEKDKLIFSFLLCTSIHRQLGEINEADWEFFVRGPVSMAQKAPPKPPLANLTETIWNSCFFLDKYHHSFKGLLTNLHNVIKISLGDLKVIFHFPSRAKTANIAHLNFEKDLTLFEKLMLIKGLKEEKTVFAITEYIKISLGKQFVESPLVSLHSLFKETSNLTPLVFVLSTGCDPVGSFLRFAVEMGYKDRAHCISLGQGQGPIAQKMIEKGRTKGDWVFLQNCHLASSWMPQLEFILLNIADCVPELHKDFRMFLSSMPSKFFPVSILQNAVKVTNEPPKGIRANLKRAFAEIDPNFFRDHPIGSRWRKMIFGLCFFHAIVLERKKFGPLGWNILYEFSESDRECALLNLDLYCQKGRFGIPWEALQYITGEITYGGRVTDIWDQRTLKTILKGFFSPSSLMDGYKYSPSGIYFCPESDICNNLESYRYFIENMPLLEEPEIFGMHENANLTFQSKETAYILITIMEIQPKESSIKEGKSSDEIVSDLSEFIKSSIDTKIMDDEVYPLHVKQDETGRVPPLSTVLFQEIDRFNKLLKIIHRSLNDLLKAIKGFVVMSDALEEIYKSFLNNTVPKLWNRSAYPSLKPLGSWTHDLQLRLDFINFWKRSGSPSSFWLPGLFFPQGFMTGVLQTSARKNSFPIDRLKIDFYVQKALIDQEDVRRFHLKYNKDVIETYKGLKPPSDGVFIHGLFLDAARFDISKMLLTDPNPGEINPKLPVLALKPVKHGVQPANRYEAPLYKTSIRAGVLSTTGHSTNFVIAVLLPTDKPQSYWILKGTALLTQISE